MAKMKLWSGTHPKPGTNKSARLLVQATSQKRAVELLEEAGYRGWTVGQFRQFFGHTGNTHAKVAAEGGCEGVWELDEDRQWQHVLDKSHPW